MNTKLSPPIYIFTLFIFILSVWPSETNAENFTVSNSDELGDAISAMPIGLRSQITITKDISFFGDIYVNRGTKVLFKLSGHTLNVYGLSRADMLSEINLEDTETGSTYNALGGIMVSGKGASVTVTNASDPESAYQIPAGSYDGGTIIIKGSLTASHDSAIQCYGKDSSDKPSSVTVHGDVTSTNEGYSIRADDFATIMIMGNLWAVESGAMAGYSAQITINGNIDCGIGYGVYAYRTSTIIVNGVITAPLPIAIGSSDLPPTNQQVEDGYTIYTRSGDDASVVKVKIQGSFDSPTVMTGVPTAITASQAVLSGEIVSDGGANVTERGFVYSMSENPTTDGSKVLVGFGTGVFNSTLTGLTENTTYHVRAYGINSVGTAYGENKAFTTSSSASLTVSAAALNIAALEGSTNTFDITSTVSWNITSNESWLTADPASGSGNAKITVTASANPLTITRVAMLTISGNGISNETINITQSAGTPAEIDCLSFVLTNEGDDLMIDQLVEAGCTNFYQAIVYLRNHITGEAPAKLTNQMDALIDKVAHFTAGEVFTTALSAFTGTGSGPVGINADGTILPADFSVYTYDGQSGFERFSANYLFTYATSTDDNIFLGSREIDLGGGVVKIVNYRAFAIAWNMVSIIKVSGSASDDIAILNIDNRTPSSRNKAWEITLTTGSLKAGMTANDVEMNGLPDGLNYMVQKESENTVIITLTGSATYALAEDQMVNLIIKGSAVNENGAQDSDAIVLNLWYVGRGTTFVITNEGRLIDQLITSGLGSKNLFEVLQFLTPISGGSISDRFLTTIESTPAEGEIFKVALNNFSGMNNPVCVNIDGTLTVYEVYGNDYLHVNGYSSSTMELSPIGNIHCTKADSPANYIYAGEISGQAHHAFAIAWIHELTLSVDMTLLTLAANHGSSGSVNVTSNTTWHAATDQDWLTVGPETGSGNGTIVITAFANPHSAMRTATVSVWGNEVSTQLITVRQDTQTGVENKLPNLISIYPNPFKDGFQVSGLQAPTTLYLYDFSGKIVKTEVVTSDTFISTNRLSPGMYFCKIVSGSSVWESKIVKNAD